MVIDPSIPARYLDAGLSVLPAIRERKHPAVGSWKAYQDRLPSDNEVEAWFANRQDALCLVCGTISGNLEVIDFDNGGELFEKWKSQIALATAIKRLWPSRLVFTYQGDGDLACIGTAETIHALNRGENITIIFINNAIYGMTGGQMAPTTLLGMKTATCPYGRDAAIHGYPLKMTEIAASLEGTAYVTRQSVHSVPAIRKAKKAIRKAFENSMNGKGSNLVEIVSTCNSGWKMTPAAANKWMEENMFPFYQLGDLKDKE